MNKPLDVSPLAGLLGPSGSAVRFTFTCMEIAESELSRAFGGSEPPGAFRVLVPPSVLRDTAPRLYTAHVRELIQRMKLGADLRPGTDAECLATFSHASLVAPPHHEIARAFDVLFRRVFPEESVGGSLSEFAGESWAGRDSEIINGVRKGLFEPSRTLDSVPIHGEDNSDEEARRESSRAQARRGGRPEGNTGRRFTKVPRAQKAVANANRANDGRQRRRR